MRRNLIAAALLAVAFLLAPAKAGAQDYFIPGAPKGPAQSAPSRPTQRPSPSPAPRPQPMPQPVAPDPLGGPQGGIFGGPAGPDDQQDQPAYQVQLPPVPELPPLPKVAPPPTAVIGVMGVPEVMRASTAAQQVDKVIGERREKLNADAQKEQAVWRDLQQQLTAQRSAMSADQIRAKERELQERITNAQKQFRERQRVIQEAAQVGVGQIERTLVAVIRQVAESHGMNLVLHRQQVALNVNEFDITDEIAKQLNKILPSVTIPAEGESPSAQAAAPASATPASAPAQGPLPGPRAKP